VFTNERIGMNYKASGLKLSSDLVSLVQYVELNRGGWWEKSICELISAYLWSSSEPQTTQEITEGITRNYSIEIDVERVQVQLGNMCREKRLVEFNSHYNLSEHTRNQLKQNSERFEQRTISVKNKFLDSMQKHNVQADGEEAWTKFSTDFLSSLIRELGVRTYELLIGANYHKWMV